MVSTGYELRNLKESTDTSVEYHREILDMNESSFEEV